MVAQTDIVRHMSLRGLTRRAIGAIVPDIEDALTTATRPHWIMGGCKVYIRRMDLGVIRKGGGRGALAKLIEQHLAQLPNSTGAREPNDVVAVFPSQIEAWAACWNTLLNQSQQPWWVSSVIGKASGQPSVSTLLDSMQRTVSSPLELHRKLGQVLGVLMQGSPHHTVRSLIDAMVEAGPKNTLVDEVIEAFQRQKNVLDVQRQGQPIVGFEAMLQAYVIRLLEVEIPSWQLRILHEVFGASLKVEVDIEKLSWAISALVQGQMSPASRSVLVTRIVRHLERVVAVQNPLQGKVVPEIPETKLTEVARDTGRENTTRSEEFNAPLVSKTVTNEAEYFSASERLYGLMSHQAGMVQMVNVLNRSGLVQQDEINQTDLILRVFLHFLERGDTQTEVLDALPDLPETDYMGLRPFCPNFETLAELGVMFAHPIVGDDNLLVLTLRGIPFAIIEMWQLAQMQTFGVQCHCSSQSIHLPQGQLSLLTGLMLFTQRLISVSLGCGWRKMIARRGYIQASQTHVDVTLDLEDVQLSERRLGLDASPGWVWWLGRVVTLHFEAFDSDRDGLQ